MLHACLSQGLQFLNQCLAPTAATKAQALHGCMWVSGKVQVDEADIGFVATDLTPERDASAMFVRGARVGEPAVHVFTDPGRRLLAQPGHQQRCGFRTLWQQMSALGQAILSLAVQQLDSIAKEFSALGVIDTEQRILHRPVTTGDPQQQATIAQLVDAVGGLEGQPRLTQRQDHRGGSEHDVLRDAGQIAEVGKGFEDLSGIAEIRVVHRYVTYP